MDASIAQAPMSNEWAGVKRLFSRTLGTEVPKDLMRRILIQCANKSDGRLAASDVDVIMSHIAGGVNDGTMPVEGFLDTVAERAEKARIRHALQSQAAPSAVPIGMPQTSMAAGQPVVEGGLGDALLASAPGPAPAGGHPVAAEMPASQLAPAIVEQPPNTQQAYGESSQAQSQIKTAGEQAGQQTHSEATQPQPPASSTEQQLQSPTVEISAPGSAQQPVGEVAQAQPGVAPALSQAEQQPQKQVEHTQPQAVQPEAQELLAQGPQAQVALPPQAAEVAPVQPEQKQTAQPSPTSADAAQPVADVKAVPSGTPQTSMAAGQPVVEGGVEDAFVAPAPGPVPAEGHPEMPASQLAPAIVEQPPTTQQASVEPAQALEAAGQQAEQQTHSAATQPQPQAAGQVSEQSSAPQANMAVPPASSTEQPLQSPAVEISAPGSAQQPVGEVAQAQPGVAPALLQAEQQPQKQVEHTQPQAVQPEAQELLAQGPQAQVALPPQVPEQKQMAEPSLTSADIAQPAQPATEAPPLLAGRAGSATQAEQPLLPPPPPTPPPPPATVAPPLQAGKQGSATPAEQPLPPPPPATEAPPLQAGKQGSATQAEQPLPPPPPPPPATVATPLQAGRPGGAVQAEQPLPAPPPPPRSTGAPRLQPLKPGTAIAEATAAKPGEVPVRQAQPAVAASESKQEDVVDLS